MAGVGESSDGIAFLHCHWYSVKRGQRVLVAAAAQHTVTLCSLSQRIIKAIGDHGSYMRVHRLDCRYGRRHRSRTCAARAFDAASDLRGTQAADAG